MVERPRRRLPRDDEQVLVIGLGRFGSRLALELMELGHEVLGVDADERIVDRYADHLTKAMVADTTRYEVLEQMGAVDFHHVVVGIGDVEASILTVAELVALGVRDVWAKALTESHRRILEKVGATRVVLPEHDMGRRIAHMITGKVAEYLELDPGYALVESRVPAALWGKTLAEADVRATYEVTVVLVKPPKGSFAYATADSLLEQGTMVLVAGSTTDVEAFAAQT